jgi:CO/xanthine dehydrogenase Mo-binding subunit
MDVAMEGMLHLKVVRSPHAHARIKAIRKDRALAGVPLTKIDASTNRIVAQWYGRGGDAIHFNYGTIWLADYDHHLVWRIKP